MGVMCQRVRESLSAHLDGEPGPLPMSAVEDHLAGCESCRVWRVDVEAMQRRVRVTSAPQLTDETQRFVAAVHDRQTREVRARWRLLPVRLGLVAVAVAQLVLTGPELLLGHDGLAPEHAAHELGAFTAALAVGLMLAAWRPRLATGMVPIVGIVAALLVVTAWLDASFGNTRITQESPHLLEVAGFLLLLRLAYLSNDRDWTPLLLPLRRPTTQAPNGGARPRAETRRPRPDGTVARAYRRASGE
jgi:predicted anti-sigma-YlaC factor YlaD